MAELARQKRVRAGHRSSSTKIMGQVEPCLSESPPDASKLTRLKRSLEDKLQSLSTLDDEILGLTPEDSIEAEIVQADECRQNIYEALSRLEIALCQPPTESSSIRPVVVAAAPRSRASPASDGTRSPELSSDRASGATTTLPTRPRVRLPKITLPRFNGDPVKWLPFWDAYNSSIHVNPELTEIDKFSYLRSLLDHTALEAIAGLSLSSANYEHAIELLHKRFGNKQVIISKHMDALMHMEHISSDRHLKELRYLYDHTESHVRCLRSLGIEASSYGALLSPVLLAKLPPDMRLIVSRKVTDTDLDIEALLKTFEEELTARERANPPVIRRSQDKHRPTASAFFAGSRDNKSDPRCCYCQGSHPSMSCTSVVSPEGRKRLLMSSGRCFNCLRRNHLSRSCKSTARCLKCKKKHHTSICDTDSSSSQSNSNQSQSVAHPSESGLNPNVPPFETTTTLCTDRIQTVFLQTARVVVYHPSNPSISLEVRLIMDGGSQRSYLSERARDLLGLQTIEEQSLSIATFGSTKGHAKVCPVVNVGMYLKGYPSIFLSLYVVSTICEPLVEQPITACASQYPHLRGLQLADSNVDSNLPVDLLIGSDYYWQLVTGSVCRGEKGPIALHTKLGWVLSGPTSCGNSIQCAMNLGVTHVLCSESHSSPEPDALQEQLHAFWELESLGIQQEEKTIFDKFMGTVKFENRRYTVSLPWKEFRDPLPDNYSLSSSRLQGLLRRLKQDPPILKEYHRIIQEQLETGIVEEVSEEEPTVKAVHYLPHHAVVRRDKSTTKVRIVYDASAKVAGSPSLNDCLLKGPKFNQLIFDILVRFRAYKFALTADLEKAFLMVSVEEADRNVLRFIWVDDPFKDYPEFKIYRFTRVVFGVSSSPFLLNATIRAHLEKYLESNETIVHKLLDSTYVDDIISGGQSEDEVLDHYSQAKMIFREGGFNLRKFQTNSSLVQARIDASEDTGSPQSELTYSETTFGTTPHSQAEGTKVLGVLWNPEDDRLTFDITGIAKIAFDLVPTKRNLVSLIGKCYDPLGFLSPMIVRFKMLFQKLCGCKCSWDDVISGETLKEWKILVADLQLAVPVSIPRTFFHELDSHLVSATLCGFCDASARAYGCVVYLVLRNNSTVAIQLVAAKTRIAPLNGQTVPRLELLSALLLSRLIASVQNSLSSQRLHLDVYCFTDSLVGLYWI